MNKSTIAKSLTAAALAAGFSIAAIAPASADQAAANRNEIIGGIALIAGIATAINVSNKNAEAQQQYDEYGYGNGYGQDNQRSFRGNDNARYRVSNERNDGGNQRDTQRGWQR
jgi:hypothetical protein